MPVPHHSAASQTLNRAVIPAAGLGTRLRPLTNAFPKELLPIGRQPVLAYIAEELRLAGITQALFIVSERKPQIRAFFGDSYQGECKDLPPLQCAYVVQGEQRGLGHALLHAEAWVGTDPFVVAFGDCMIEAAVPAAPLLRMIAVHREQRASATTLVEQVAWDNVSRYGVLAPEAPLEQAATQPFAARDIVEKPARAEAPSNLVVAARWILQPEIFSFLHRSAPDARGETNLTDAVRALRRSGSALWAVPLGAEEARRDIGNFDTFFAAFVRRALCDPEAGASARHAAREVLATLPAE